MVPDRLVVIGGSAGALGPLREILSRLPASFPAPVLVCLHVGPRSKSRLPEVLASAGALGARHPRHGEPLEAGTILVAPPDRHLVVHDHVVHLSRGPLENRHRPAVDALFNSAARWHGPAVSGVVLSGALDDGSAGAAAIAAQDGVVIVQDPHEAGVAGMPQAAIRAVRRARVAPARDIPALLADLVDVPERPGLDPLITWKSENVDSTSVPPPSANPGSPTALGCPDCHGGMFETATSWGPPHYMCHVGHSWAPESLMDAQRQASEAAMYAAAAKLLEEATVLRRVADLRRDSGGSDEANGLEARAEQAEHSAPGRG